MPSFLAPLKSKSVIKSGKRSLQGVSESYLELPYCVRKSCHLPLITREPAPFLCEWHSNCEAVQTSGLEFLDATMCWALFQMHCEYYLTEIQQVYMIGSAYNPHFTDGNREQIGSI